MTYTNDALSAFSYHIDETISTVAKLRAEHQENATVLQRVVDHMAKLFSRPWFIGAISIVIAGWIGLNLISATLGRHTIDPPPFAWLGGAISLTSLYMVVLILASQKREDQLQLLEESRRDNPILRNRLDPEAETMGRAANTQSVLNAITETPDFTPA